MNLMLVTTGLRLGGAECVVASIANHFSSLPRYKVTVVSLTSVQEVKLGPAVRVIKLSGHKSLTSLTRILLRLRAIERRIRPDIIHAHMVHANLICRLALCHRHRRLICTAHSIKEGGRLENIGYAATDFLCAVNTQVSDEGAETYIRKGLMSRQKMRVVRNGIDVSRFKSQAKFPERGIRKILMAGRLVPQKNQALGLRIFLELAREYLDIELTIVGRGPEETALRAMASSDVHGDRIAFAGQREDMEEVYRQHHLLLHTSDFEGFGLVLAEAMIAGLTVVARDCGGTREVVGDNWQLVGSDGAAEQIKKAVRRALELRPRQAAKIIEHNQTRIETLFSLQSALQQWRSLYEDVLSWQDP